MAFTPAERAKQEAEAFKARAWYRDLANLVYGFGEYRSSNGQPDKMRHELRELRTLKSEQRSLNHHGWSLLESVMLLSTTALSARHQEEVSSMLETLRLQTPDIFNWIDEKSYATADVPLSALGHFKTDEGLEELLSHTPALPDAFRLGVEKD